MDKKRLIIMGIMAVIFMLVWNGLAGIVDATNSPVLYRFNTISTVALTIPTNGDVNPYGVARVKHSRGNLKEGHILVSNFNKSAKPRGKAPVILDIAPNGTVNTFAKITPETLPGACPGGLGLTTGLVVLQDGWVIVGSLPANYGKSNTSQSGCLIVLDSTGKPVETFSGSLINGPRDMVAYENNHEVKLFVTNVLNGTAAANGRIVNKATVVRIDLNVSNDNLPQIGSMVVVGSGFPARTDPDALVLGPTGLGLSPGCGNSEEENCPDHTMGRGRVLYIADSLNNRIAVIEDALYRSGSAGIGETLSTGGSLNDPLGLIVAPNGHVLTVNRADGFITEITAQGQQIATVPAGQYRNTAWNRTIEQSL